MVDEDYARLAGPALRRLNASPLSDDQKARANRLVVFSSLQLKTARFGYKLYQNQLTGTADLTAIYNEWLEVIELASGNLVYRCLVSTFDLCAAALYWMVFSTPLNSNRPDQEADVERWGSDNRLRDSLTGGQVPSLLTQWIQNLRADPRWSLLSDFRHAYTHRWVRRNVTISFNVPMPSNPTPSTRVVVNRREYNLIDYEHDLLLFADEQFKEFLDAVERTY